jgi:hypothetical protein
MREKMTDKNYLEILMQTLLKEQAGNDGNITGSWCINAFSIPHATAKELHMLWIVEMEVYYVGPKFSPCVLTLDAEGNPTLYFLVRKQHQSECGIPVTFFRMNRD